MSRLKSKFAKPKCSKSGMTYCETNSILARISAVREGQIQTSEILMKAHHPKLLTFDMKQW